MVSRTFIKETDPQDYGYSTMLNSGREVFLQINLFHRVVVEETLDVCLILTTVRVMFIKLYTCHGLIKKRYILACLIITGGLPVGIPARWQLNAV